MLGPTGGHLEASRGCGTSGLNFNRFLIANSDDLDHFCLPAMGVDFATVWRFAASFNSNRFLIANSDDFEHFCFPASFPVLGVDFGTVWRFAASFNSNRFLIANEDELEHFCPPAGVLHFGVDVATFSAFSSSRTRDGRRGAQPTPSDSPPAFYVSKK
jgi:hypothetical protein